MAFTTARSSTPINVTPLINVLLVLLIIFMVIEPTAARGLATLAPTNSSRVAASSEPPAIIVVAARTAAAAAYRIDGSIVSPSQVAGRLQELVQQQGRRSVYVGGSPDLAYAEIAFVVDAAHAAGADAVAMVPLGSAILQQ